MTLKDELTKELECVRCHCQHLVAPDDDLFRCIRCGDELIPVEQIKQFKDMMND